jgi:hypothetical protein
MAAAEAAAAGADEYNLFHLSVEDLRNHENHHITTTTTK